MPNWNDNVLTVTGPSDVLDAFLQGVSGDNGLVDFTSHLPQAPLDDETGRELSWWRVNAYDPHLHERAPEKLVICFQTAWEPPLPWAECLAEQYPDLPMTLLFAEEGEGFAGLWVADEDGTADNCLSVRVVGYPAVWAFLNGMGWDFGWDDPEGDPEQLGRVPQVG